MPDTTSVTSENSDKAQGMNIFPNPASTECKISFAKPVTNVEIKLIDMSGDIKGYWRV